jgi:hypothetical protein
MMGLQCVVGSVGFHSDVWGDAAPQHKVDQCLFWGDVKKVESPHTREGIYRNI